MSNALARPFFNRLAVDGNADLNFQALQRLLSGLFVPKIITHALSPYTVLATDEWLLCDATGGAITLTFPAASRVDGMRVDIKKIDASANAVTLSATIDGAANPTLAAQYKSMTVRAGNGVYYKLAST